MRALKIMAILMCLLVIAMAVTPVLAGKPVDLGHETLAPNDGWASQGTGTTGGAAATPSNVFTVHNRKELIMALNDGVLPSTSSATPSNTPKIIYVDGTIDANVDDNNQPLTCANYMPTNYNPALWGANPVPADFQAAWAAGKTAQQDRVRIRVGSNTTIVGVGNKATIKGAWLDVRGSSATKTVSNIIIRNINFQDVYDCFPSWDPGDGTNGSWNSLYDAISFRYANHVWVDHNSFQDLATIDSAEPTYLGVHFERHDGLVDITNGSDFVTVSWNIFRNHDKVMLIGSSDSGSTATGDRGKLNVTIHHNLFDSLGQRTPRVRFGKVHVYNNYYKLVNNPGYVYSWGVGIESSIYAENNYVQTDQSITPDQLIGVYKGTAIYTAGTRINGTPGGGATDVVGAFNATHTPALATSVGWTPSLHLEVEDTQKVVSSVHSGAGPFNW